MVVVLDGSESMQTPDAPGPRIEAARAAVKDFVSDLAPETPFGLVVYGNTGSARTVPQEQGCQDVTTVIPLGSVDEPQALDAIDEVQPLG